MSCDPKNTTEFFQTLGEKRVEAYLLEDVITGPLAQKAEIWLNGRRAKGLHFWGAAAAIITALGIFVAVGVAAYQANNPTPAPVNVVAHHTSSY